MTPEHWQKIDDLLEAALGCAANERAAFLDQACAGDEALRRKLEALLAAHEQAGSFIETPAIAVAAQALAEQARSIVGRQLGRYHILSLLGAGGMGEVYRAIDTRLNREVAIKVLPSHLTQDAVALARFEREAQAVAALSHPNILAIHDFGAEQDIHYAVTELLDGETLRSRLALGALPWRAAIVIGVAVADGLAAAHAKGIIHRDLKPENIFLTSDGRVKILDFGLARRKLATTLLNANSTPTVSYVTEPGLVMGTVGYMSPEQVRGEEVDEQSDIFSFGCVLYEMVAGERAFARQSAAEILAAILRDEPPKLAEIGQNVPTELERVVDRCLKKKADDRYQSARDLAIDLEAMLSGAVIATPTPAHSSKRMRPAIWAAAILALLLAGLSLYQTKWWWRDQPVNQPIDSIAVLPLVNVSGDSDTEYLSDGLTEDLINSLSHISKLRVIARATVFRYKNRDVDPIRVGGELNVRAVLTGRVILRGDTLIIQAALTDVTSGTQLWGERFNRKLTDILTVQNEVARHISERLHLRLTREEQQQLIKRYTENVEAYQLYLTGRFQGNKGTVEGIMKGMQSFNLALKKDPDYALAYVGLSDSYGQLGQISLPPRQVAHKARANAERALGLDDNLAEAHLALAAHHFFYGFDWAEAERELNRAQELKPGLAFAHDLYGQYLSAQGRFNEAIAESKSATEIDQFNNFAQSNLGFVYYYAGQYDQVIEQCRKTLELDSNFFFTHLFMGWAYGQQGKYEEAITTLIRTRELPGGFVPATSELGYIYGISGRQAEAQKMLGDLHVRAKREFVDPYYIAIVYHGLGDQQETFAWLNKAYDERSFLLPWLKVEPKFERLRSDPRFVNLMRRVGLAP
jgi:serine/threonine protein kinase/tetratricopeptide (TPR) repeat protein